MQIPATFPSPLTVYDFWELSAFRRKMEIEGFQYTLEHYHPGFEFVNYWPIPGDQLQELLRVYGKTIRESWNLHGEHAVGLHNLHIGTAELRSRKRIARKSDRLWGVEYLTGVIHRCPTAQWARWVSQGTPGSKLVPGIE